MTTQPRRRVDVVILTAVPLEYQAVLAVSTGAWPGSEWGPELGPHGLPVVFRKFRGRGGHPLTVAVVQSPNMGVPEAIQTLLPLAEEYRPACIAMAGVCAGRREKTHLGDVIAADRLFVYDAGKQLPDRVELDLQTYNLLNDWKVALQNFDFAARFEREDWWLRRPIPLEWQENWILSKLIEGDDPKQHPEELETYCKQWEVVLQSLWRSGDLMEGEIELTEKGRKRIGRVLNLGLGRLPDFSPRGGRFPFKVHVAPIASGSMVVEDERVFGFITQFERKALGLEMEAAALGIIAHGWQSRGGPAPRVLVMKGVMDFANQGRSDHFVEFAARASAECLLLFLREHLDLDVLSNLEKVLSTGHEELPSEPPPSMLLAARHGVVPFSKASRAEILEQLDRWCDEEPLEAAIRLVHAEGGAGKTRLAIEWTQQRRTLGWVAGFLPRVPAADWLERLHAKGRPALVVIDYAESHPWLEATLLGMLRFLEARGEGGPRIRVLLLARNDGDWFQALRSSHSTLKKWLDVTPPVKLAPLANNAATRRELFLSATRAFRERTGKSGVAPGEVSLEDERFATALYLHMAALAFVEGLAFGPNNLMDVILEHEERFWVSIAGDASVIVAERRFLARQIVAGATLRGGIQTRESALAMVDRLLTRARSENDEALVRLLHRIYLHHDSGSRDGVQPAGESLLPEKTLSSDALYLPALEPDLLGEGMVLRVATPDRMEDQVSADWIDRVFPSGEEAQAVTAGFTVLDRASGGRAGPLLPWLKRMLAGRLLGDRVSSALDAAKAVGLRTPFSQIGEVLAVELNGRGDVAMASTLECARLPHPTVSLRKVSEWTHRTLLDSLPRSDDEETQVRRVALLNRHAIALRELGEGARAVTRAREAVELCRGLVARNPEMALPDFAKSLRNLGAALVSTGPFDDAVAATEEAIGCFRTLAERQPQVYLPELATSLLNLGAALFERHRHDEAEKALKEAIRHYEALVERGSKESLADLAMSLNNLGANFFDAGRREEALEATERAVGYFRTLVKQHPDAYLPDLAMSLVNLCGALFKTGQRPKALAAGEEAVGLYRQLRARHPHAFLPQLAGSLNNVSNLLSLANRHEEALNAAEEVVELYSKLVQRNPEAFENYLAMSLNNLSNRLSKVGRAEEALTRSEDAVKLYRALAGRRPDEPHPGLAMALNTLGSHLTALERREEGVAVAEEAVGVYRALAARRPDAFLPNLALGLATLASGLRALGRRTEALPLMKEVVDLRRPMWARYPGVFRNDLVASLQPLGELLRELGRNEEAQSAFDEAKAVSEEASGSSSGEKAGESG